ncbi:uncharacterized protein LAESUDRAFT_794327 [Laetiporus sulphureus 93-53]|uniref:G-protein coupled receptors family 1 profile domain-containing protein n=1 Tax=Laetiporus sulphureus 93-53 TaxID=1314785 RepID=A0A165C3L6_9APHY|nr:uncharacterized protein LAESUDRAFT_794327 [Laetiporus sulphureus 93-53]KZT02145.1 hypothetical protein LAESUDRAFT_794327 [Laetiporus sulphureus 93-53]
MNITSPISPPDAGTQGPILMQGLRQYLLQGVILSQGAKFCSRCANDSARLRLYVASLVFSSVLQTVLETYKVWMEVIDHLHWYIVPLYSTEFLLNGLICIMCEGFLIRRCWKSTQRSYLVLAGLRSLALATFTANIYLAVRIATTISIASGYADPLKVCHWAFPLWVFGSLTLSISFTCILSMYLWKIQTGLTYLDKMLRNIIVLTWETAALPSTCTIIAAVFYCSREVMEFRCVSFTARSGITDPRHLDLLFILLTAKRYTLGILRTLNARVHIRECLASKDLGRVTLSDYNWNDASAPSSSSTRKVCISLCTDNHTLKIAAANSPG